MIKKFVIVLAINLLCACSYLTEFMDNLQPQEQGAPVLTAADYADYAKNVTIAAKDNNYIIYEYRNIRVDDLAVLAALYCHDHGNTRAYLDNITLYHNNSRRAKFMCR